jgi:hypothetical protein
MPDGSCHGRGIHSCQIFPEKTFEKFNIEKLQDAFTWSMIVVRLQNLYTEKVRMINQLVTYYF